ncbi:hypothetical protein MIND_00516900 [Mycena indigotica]|uniref:Uncharacterized protein n=1 Tax=Mycena indigotica TaxID=2126181 RepID=A0A8H6W719_9AGAR|nr:uncharacterized protein MIND_00516900 [Mycena indigotica]KAF7307232.1 hypothetical protein MIND_00516900 [Mycena indigotica]
MPAPLSTSNANAYPRFDTQQLTPRTPHSRAGRAEEAYTAAELEQIDFDDDDYNSVVQQQNAPLLASSASDSFPSVGYRSRGDDYEERIAATATAKRRTVTEQILARLPLALYSSVAAVLLVLVFVSLREPEALKKYVGASSNSSTAASPSQSPSLSTPHMHTDHLPEGVALISYENYTKFPLDPIEYRSECIKLTPALMKPHPFWFSHEPKDVPHVDEQPGYQPPTGQPPICNRTITYQLDGWAGLLTDIALISQFAALAREREATFFVDDRYWNRGKWTDHFEPIHTGPEPGCRPPPPEEYVACPRTARHWIVNSRTARYHLGHAFSENYEDPYGHDLNRLKPIYNAAQKSFEAIIKPSSQSATLIKWAREEMQDMVTKHYQARSFKGQSQEYEFRSMGYIGVHIRRGDQSRTWKVYGQQYVPVSDYVDGVVGAWSRLDLELSKDDKPVTPVAYIASDDPAVMKEFSSSFDSHRVFSLSTSKRKELRELASPGAYVQNDFMNIDEKTRVTATRGMVVDFALVSGAWANTGDLIPDATVCGISSVVCKFAVVAMGWQRAFGEVDDMGYMDKKNNRWVEVDNRGRIVPAWEPFQAP